MQSPWGEDVPEDATTGRDHTDEMTGHKQDGEEPGPTGDPQVCPPKSLHHTPYTSHPTPYTPHPTPCTLHPTPYTLHPTPYNQHPTPCTLHPTPHTALNIARRAAACDSARRARVFRASLFLPPWSRVQGKSKANLPQMPPLQGGICMEFDKRNHQFAPGLPWRSLRQARNASCAKLECWMSNPAHLR